MKKKYLIHFICFIFVFLLVPINRQVFADTTSSITSITLNKTSSVLTVGQTDSLSVSFLPADAVKQSITWTSSNTGVAKVFNGVVMAIGKGTAIITATTADGKNTATCAVIVNNLEASIMLDKSTDVLTVGSTDTLTATTTPTQAVTWSSSNTDVVQVFNGVLMAQKVGTATITVVTADGKNTATCAVTVKNAPATVTLSKTTDIIEVGATDSLKATLTNPPTSDTILMWISSNPNVVSVSGGVITGLSLGTSVITAISSDGSGSATCNVTVAAEAVNGKNVIRLGGANRYETSVAIAQAGWKDKSTYAVLATGEDYPDALSAAPLAKKYNAPILLANKSSLPQNTIDEIKKLNVTQVFICGGTGAVSQNVENQLNAMKITTERIGGADRFETSVKISKKLGVVSGELIVANGYGWSDALSASSIAAKMGIPIILTDKNKLRDSTNTFIEFSNFSKTYILGDTDIISDEVAEKFANPERIVGNNQYERNINIIKKFQSNLDMTNICVATGVDFPDALSGSALAASLSSAIVLVDGNNIQDVTTQYTAQSLTNANNIYVFGLQGAVSKYALNSLFPN